MIKAAGYIIILFLAISSTAFAQQDTTEPVLFSDKITSAPIDSIAGTISPRKAAIRSAIIPGWGQVYVRKDLDMSFFKKYWKLPIIYGAIGTSVGVFVYNLEWYRRTRFAYTTLYNKDTDNYPNVHTKLQAFIINEDAESLRYYRDEFRRNVDYSVLFFIVLWGLNVVDATVDAHLRSFDVTPDLGLRLKPGYSDLAGTNGISLVLTFK